MAFGAPTGWRTTARIAVRADGNGGAAVGMFKPGTHQVIPCAVDVRCHLPHHPAINDAVAAIAQQLNAFKGELSAYDEAGEGRGGDGTLRYLQLAVERSTRRVQVTLVANAASLDADPALERFADALWKAHANQEVEYPLHSLWVNLNPSLNNNILSYEDEAWWLLHSQQDSMAGHAALPYLHELIPDPSDIDDEDEDLLDAKQLLLEGGSLVETLPTSNTSFVLPPYVFRQANLEHFDEIVQQVVAAVKPGAKVVEWYAGVGVLGLSLVTSRGVEWVKCSDINPPNAAFEASKLLLPTDLQSAISYAVGGAGERIDDARGADTAVVDPPRKGLDQALLDALCASQATPCSGLTTLVYVSADSPRWRATRPRCSTRAGQYAMARRRRTSSPGRQPH